MNISLGPWALGPSKGPPNRPQLLSAFGWPYEYVCLYVRGLFFRESGLAGLTLPYVQV